MIMKKIFMMTMLMLALISCKDQVQQISGSYSYKISGRANIEGNIRNLSDEIGTMDILHKTADSAVLTFNALQGPVYYTTAKIKGKQIELDTINRIVTYATGQHPVKVAGSGTIYSESIIFNLRYMGTTLNADSLVMVCKKN